ncbi:hypothetical protein EJP82_27135 [Paenibacillus anaericanus]|uniref:Uncharacterized protein n=1 Tax=Paenibacillus anaericanus TaxID=170367 RepID=A0A433XVC0_9BACL|nr:hypothetical protein [Paenibacillus anaericanus]RUT38532.1 hypothetical protein EJP82_27135 [Paenibacillus anaericanus]
MIDIEFNKGVATVPLTLFTDGIHNLTFRLVGIDLVGLLNIEVKLNGEQSDASEPVREQSLETNSAVEEDVNIIPDQNRNNVKDKLFEEELVVNALLSSFKMSIYQYPTYMNYQGKFDLHLY